MKFLTKLYSKFDNQKKVEKTFLALAISILVLFLLNIVDQNNVFFDTMFTIVIIFNIVLNLTIYFERKR